MTINNMTLVRRSLHTGEVVGSIPTAPTIEIRSLLMRRTCKVIPRAERPVLCAQQSAS